MSSEKGFDKKAAEIEKLKAQLRRREEENIGLSKKIDSQASQIEDLTSENRDLRETINRAKNISPWARPNRYNVQSLAKKAHIDIVKVSSGWVVKMAERIGKKFKRLRDIWLILTREEWYLHDDFFPHPESVATVPTTPIAPTTPTVPAAQLANALSTLCVNPLAKEQNQIEVLRAEWRLFPSMREAIEEKMAQFGIALTPT